MVVIKLINEQQANRLKDTKYKNHCVLRPFKHDDNWYIPAGILNNNDYSDAFQQLEQLQIIQIEIIEQQEE